MISIRAARRVVFSLLLLSCAASPATAQREPVTPERGSPARAAIMEALREVVGPDLGKPVIFEVSHLKMQDDYAFLIGVPRKPDGAAFDYRGTPYQTALDEGEFVDRIYAVLAKINGRWRTLEYGFGTDVAWIAAVGKFGSPPGIFPEPAEDEHHHH